ncbi:glutathione S-transferase family protein [Aspergillus homomorphus CBS 101889]|uniref:glutathione transferase n=1 Tax=Aspergillus homomorphus (strain CBS 101889) TaxID=1450537 RepID=A0A395I8T2_ASPHC|nr:glutathione S-transferase [Aspergillus homomorphus CBS 101889]RAL16642.1 glutathione S-transferase [Aspergillus homomorphus CBS 101889]
MSDPTITIHHLHLSQSERVLWLCEELNLPYNLKCYHRDPVTSQAPAAYRALHPAGTSPVLQDGSATLAESNAIFEYVLTKYDTRGTLALAPTHPKYPDYVFWLHHANGSIMPALIHLLFAQTGASSRSGSDSPSSGDQVTTLLKERLSRSWALLEAQLAKYPYVAGETLTAADCMLVFALTTFRLFLPFSLVEYPNVVAYLGRVASRPAYLAAMEKGDPGLKRPLGAMVGHDS